MQNGGKICVVQGREKGSESEKKEKRKADERWGRKVSEKYETNKKLFWKELKDVRKTGDSVVVKVKDGNGNVVGSEQEVKERWERYFDSLTECS